MYSIIGADGGEYGPVSKDVLVQWAVDGRVVERTTVLDHDTGRRYLACDMAELAAVFGGATAVAPPRVAQPLEVTPPARPTLPMVYRPRRSRALAGVLGIVFGMFGVHRFYLGYTGTGTIMLALTLLTCGLLAPVTFVWGLVEGVLCLTGAITDAEGNRLGA